MKPAPPEAHIAQRVELRQPPPEPSVVGRDWVSPHKRWFAAAVAAAAVVAAASQRLRDLPRVPKSRQ